MLKLIKTIFFLAVLFIAHAGATEAIYTYVPDAQKVGQGRLRVMLWDVYDATLYAPGGRWDARQPFALRLFYLRSLSGNKIADRSAEEIRAQGFTDEIKLADWHTQMRNIFPDVKEGSSLTGIITSTGKTVFYSDAEEVGMIEDPEFGLHFFNIWLGEKTRSPELRRKLLGKP